MSDERLQRRAQRPATARILLLPGANERGDGFARAGFHDAVRERGLAIELECCDLEFEHLTDRTMLKRLHDGPLADARASGCDSVWLGGVSLGGFIALAYAERFPAELTGLCLIAPYLGSRILTREISQAGGVAAWSPGEQDAEDEDRQLWRFIKSRRSLGPMLYLGSGRDDRFADSHRLLAEVLPAESVDVVNGAHDWPAWRQVWNHFLDKWSVLSCAR